MPNKKYLRGYAKERELVLNYRKKGWESFRSAGSHSPIDVFACNEKEIHLCQCKRVKTLPIPKYEKDLNQLKNYKSPTRAYIKKFLCIWVDRQKGSKGEWLKIRIK